MNISQKMEDRLKKRKTSSKKMKMEDDLIFFWKLKNDIKFLILEDNLNFLKMEDDLNGLTSLLTLNFHHLTNQPKST